MQASNSYHTAPLPNVLNSAESVAFPPPWVQKFPTLYIFKADQILHHSILPDG